MRPYLIVFAALSMSLAACGSQKDWWGWPDNHWASQDFKPYLKEESQSFPTAYGTESWAYPQGAPTAEIIQRWREAGLVMSVTSGGRKHIWSTPSGVLTVFVGPNFYNLSASSQRGLADAIAQIYGVGQQGRQGYLLLDSGTGKGVGTYTLVSGLQTY
ncbi:MAG TPA: hypothetical protein VIN59_03660 [Alphaproteobacteria bacterium]